MLIAILSATKRCSSALAFGRAVAVRATTTFSSAEGAWAGWWASLSYAAGASSAWSILGVTGIAYRRESPQFGSCPAPSPATSWRGFFIAPRLRRLAAEKRYVTLTDFLIDGLQDRQRQAAILVSSVAILFCFSFYVAAQFQGAGTTLAASFDINAQAAILSGAAIILVYTCLGGFWAVSITDALQAVVMFVAALILPIAVLVELGGFAPIFAALDRRISASPAPTPAGLAAGFLLGMVSIGFGPLGQPHMLNRMMALADEGALSRARIIALGWFVVVLGGMFSPASPATPCSIKFRNPNPSYSSFPKPCFRRWSVPC